jgi:hypothetical protein
MLPEVKPVNNADDVEVVKVLTNLQRRMSRKVAKVLRRHSRMQLTARLAGWNEEETKCALDALGTEDRVSKLSDIKFDLAKIEKYIWQRFDQEKAKSVAKAAGLRSP